MHLADAKTASQIMWLAESDLSPMRIEMVGTDGKMKKIWNKVKPAGHAAEVLAALQA